MIITNRQSNLISFEKKGESFYGSTRQHHDIIRGLLTPETAGQAGNFIVYHQWAIYVNNATIDCITETVHQFTNENRKPTVEALYILMKDSYVQATRLFNEQLQKNHIHLMPRDVLEHAPGKKMVSILEALLLDAFAA